MTRNGATPKTRHSAARIPAPTHIDGPTSPAAAAGSLRGWPSRPMPAALTKVSAVSPPVRASTPTPMGMATAMAGFDEGRPCSMAWSSSHSLTKPHSGGRAAMARPPTRKIEPVTGIRAQQPAELVEVPGPRRLLDRAGGEEERSLEHGVEDHVQQGGDQGHQRQRPVAGRGEQPRGAHAEQHQPDVVGGRVGQQALEVGARRRVQ